MGFVREDVEKLSSELGEPGWVLGLRVEAWEFFEKFELPGEKDEPWRYTDLRRLKFKLDGFTPAKPDSTTQITEHQTSLLGSEGERGGYVIQRDADVVHKEVQPDLPASGVIFTDLNTAIREHEDLVKEHLFKQFRTDDHIFSALHGALFSGGTFLYVPRGVTVALPVESQRWIDEPGTVMSAHSLIVVEEGAEVVYFERFESTPLGADSISLAATEISVGQAARVSVVTLQEYGDGIWHFHNQRATTGQGATFRSLVVSLGGRFSRQEVDTAMKGDGGSVEMLGLYFAEKGQHFDFRTLQDHAAGHCTSDLLYKGALKDDSHTVYSGLIHVRPEGIETDAYQTNRNLVLSDHAKADSKPELEIENNDVRCSHGASVGQVNEDEVFYLMSRGIPRADAEVLIVNGFFEEVIGRITNQEIREVLTTAIENKLAT